MYKRSLPENEVNAYIFWIKMVKDLPMRLDQLSGRMVDRNASSHANVRFVE